MTKTTIAAISTPYGSGGIGIIRVSGDQSIQILEALFEKSGCRDGDTVPVIDRLESHRFYHVYIRDSQTGQRVDEVLVVAMLGPRSYTREDVVEIHSHSGPVVLGKIFEQVINRGAAIAEPGEFTKRAFLNGRIDLTQAEAVIDIIQAKSETALQIANHQLAGGLTQKIDPIREALQSIRVLVEAAIDFPEDIEESVKTQSIQDELELDVIAKIDQILGDYKADHYFRDGVKMAVIGRPNVGKSSLMNRLIDRDRAIVTAIPGTTRDVIEEVIHIKGLPIVIMDTAGLHTASGEVEKIGMQKTQQSIQDADIVLFMIDASMDISSEDNEIYVQIENKKHLIVYNKIDLILADQEQIISTMWKDHAVVRISALNGTNLDQLKRKLWSLVVGKTGLDREIGVVPNMRHKKQLETCLAAAKRARRAIKEELPAELIATDIMDAIKTLGAILGEQYPSDLLDQIFSRFCIGK